MNGLFDHAFLGLARHSRLMAVIALLIVGLFASAVRPPTYSGSMVGPISAGNPAVLAASQIAAARGNVVDIVILVEAGPVTIAEAFLGVAALEATLAAADIAADIRSVHSLADRLFLFGLTLDDPLATLLSSLNEDDDLGMLVSQDETLFAIAVSVSDNEELAALRLIRAHDFSTGLSGAVVLASAALEEDVASGLRKDLRLLIPAIVFVMLGVLLIAFGHWRSLILPLFGSLASSVAVFSLLSLSGISINLVTLLALPIVLIVALANSCHFLAKSTRARGTDQDLTVVIARSLKRVALPYLISSLTTAVALASLGLNQFEPIRDLGLLSAASLLVSFVLILLFAPWSLRWHLDAEGRSFHLTHRYQRFSAGLRRRRRVIGGLLVGAAFAGVLSFGSVEVRSDARIFFPDNARFTAAFRLFEERFYVFAPIRILIREHGETAPTLAALRFAGRMRDSISMQSGVLRADLAPAASDNGLLLTAVLSDNSVTDAVASAARSVWAEDQSSYEVVISSAQIVYESIDRQALSSLTESLSVSLLIIFGVIAILFRSLRALVAALVANGVPLLIIFGVVWLVGDPLNLVTAFVFLVALGVIVDDTIHILYRYQHDESLAGSSMEFSVILSTAMLCAGLLLCQLSDFPTTRQFALYCALALTAAVASDLTLLPTLLKRRGSQP